VVNTADYECTSFWSAKGTKKERENGVHINIERIQTVDVSTYCPLELEIEEATPYISSLHKPEISHICIMLHSETRTIPALNCSTRGAAGHAPRQFWTL
jgi:hypothetical protein